MALDPEREVIGVSEAVRAAAVALVDVYLSVAADTPPLALGEPPAMTVEEQAQLEEGLLALLGRLPSRVRRQAVKKAIRAVLDLESSKGRKPSQAMYEPIRRHNWNEARLRRNPPNRPGRLRRGPPSNRVWATLGALALFGLRGLVVPRLSGQWRRRDGARQR